MSAFAPIMPSKVHFSEYIRTDNKPEEPVKPAAPAEQPKPAAK
jgi:hypothetical protein